jgi:hypothetical protein
MFSRNIVIILLMMGLELVKIRGLNNGNLKRYFEAIHYKN